MYNIPIYEAVILDNGDFGIQAVALVDDPAVAVDFQCFKKEEPQTMKFSIESEEQHIIFGVIARANYPMLRLTAEGLPYYVTFSADTIKLMAQKYLRENKQNQIKLTHSEGTETKDVEMVECFIKDTVKGINPIGFEEVADGSLFGAFKVMNEDIWAEIKNGTFAGFSMEINIGVEVPIEDPEEQLYNEVETLLEEIKNKIKNVK